MKGGFSRMQPIWARSICALGGTGMAKIDPNNAAALVVALANLARDGELDLADCDIVDITTVYTALAPWVLVNPDED
jgi:hypothetical protein